MKEYTLVIMPLFYGYSIEIKNELEKKHYLVDLLYEQPGTITFLIIRNLNRLFKTSFFYSIFLSILYLKLLIRNRKYKYVIVIRGNILTASFINRIKEKFLQPDGRTIFYTWDSLIYLNHQGKLANVFDKKFSFDSDDVYNDNTWILHPLFYLNIYDYANSRNIPSKTYDICCISGFNEYRYSFLKTLAASNPHLKFYFFLYIDKTLLEYKKKRDNFYSNLDLSWLSFDILSPEEVVKICNSSFAILDITDKKQSGLSMRTIESVGLNQKLITNNIKVKEYDFYNNNNIWVLENNNIVIPKSWLQSKYVFNEEIRKRYSLSNWVDTLLS